MEKVYYKPDIAMVSPFMYFLIRACRLDVSWKKSILIAKRWHKKYMKNQAKINNHLLQGKELKDLR